MTDRPERSLFEPAILWPALLGALRKLDPRAMARNPVMFVVELGAVFTTVLWIVGEPGQPGWFAFTVAVWLWLTVIFGNFAEAIAEGRGSAQAATLRAMRRETTARLADGTARAGLRAGPRRRRRGRGGRADPRRRHRDRGHRLRRRVGHHRRVGARHPRVRRRPQRRHRRHARALATASWWRSPRSRASSFLDRMIALVEGAARRKTPNEIALSILLAGLTIVFLVVVVTLRPFAEFAGTDVSVTVLIALLVALIPTTIGALLSAIGIAGMDRLVRRNVLALSGRAVEASGDVDVLLLDKTGTITLGNRQAAAFVPMPGVSEAELAEAAQLASLADETPEGRSIVVLAKQYGLREHELAALRRALRAVHGADPHERRRPERHAPAQGRRRRRAALGRRRRAARRRPSSRPSSTAIARQGSTPLAVARDSQVLGVVELKDVVKEGMRERFERLRAMGIRTVMVTGDNPLTAAKIAEEAGVDDFLAEATPEAKLALIREQQAEGRLVAMTGDGTNDAPALAQADVGVAMNTGTQAAREAGQHGRPRLQPDEADRDRRGRQAAAHHARRADHVLDRQRRREVLRDPPAVFAFTYGVDGARGPIDELNVMALGTPRVGDHLRDRLQRPDHPAAGAAGPARGALPARRARRRCCAATC